MRLLLDTCALLALAEGTLPRAAAEALATAEQALISPVVPWELAIKVKTGKLMLADPPLLWVENLAARHQLTLSPGGLDAALLCAAADLPLLHRDPFDRVLIATARVHRSTLVTSDQTIPEYPDIEVIWK